MINAKFQTKQKIIYPQITLYKKIFQLPEYSVGKSSSKYLLSTHFVPDTVLDRYLEYNSEQNISNDLEKVEQGNYIGIAREQ